MKTIVTALVPAKQTSEVKSFVTSFDNQNKFVLQKINMSQLDIYHVVLCYHINAFFCKKK